MKKIKIACQGAGAVEYFYLVAFQGELKSLSKTNYEKLRKEILELGFSEPISVWRHDGKHFILNGHQRLRTIQQMVEKEGYTCPPLPVTWVEADDFRQAKRKVLALTSQFGRIEDEGLFEFMSQAEISIAELAASFDFAGFNLDHFAEGYFSDVGVQLPVLPSGEREPYQQITFTLHDSQAAILKRALAQAKAKGPFKKTVNENSNGNALARICEAFVQE